MMVEPLEMVASRGKTLLCLAASLAFVALAVLLPRDGGDETWRWLCCGFFGLGVVIVTAVAIRPQRLLLDQEGFTLAGGLARRPKRRAWRDIYSFFVHRLPRGGPAVFYNFADHARPDTYLGDLNRRWGGDALLPKTLPGKPEAIAATLNAYKAAALGL